MTLWRLDRCMEGSILDIGGGGEGVIGRLYTRQVTAIDNRQEELDEAPDCCRKICMDAAKLTFPDQTFDHITFFYSLMYMSRKTKRLALAEAVRVMKPNGSLSIWDTEIRSAYPEPHLVDLEICLPEETWTTTYGILEKDAAQSAGLFSDLGEKLGLQVLSRDTVDGQFYLVFRK